MTANYTTAVRWIANNDGSDVDLEAVAAYVSVAMVADLFGHALYRVANDVVNVRTGHVTLQFSSWENRGK